MMPIVPIRQLRTTVWRQSSVATGVEAVDEAALGGDKGNGNNQPIHRQRVAVKQNRSRFMKP